MDETMNETYLIAEIPDSAPMIVKVRHGAGGQIEDALRVAAHDWLRTPEGQAYNESINFDFNWGDIFQIHPEILMRHGISSLTSVIKSNASIALVWHDESLGEKQGGDNG